MLLLAAFIEKNTYAGLEEFYAGLAKAVYEDCEGVKAVGGAGDEDDRNNNNIVADVAPDVARNNNRNRQAAAAAAGDRAKRPVINGELVAFLILVNRLINH